MTIGPLVVDAHGPLARGVARSVSRDAVQEYARHLVQGLAQEVAQSVAGEEAHETAGENVQGVEFTRDGKRLVSAGADGCIHVWSMPGLARLAKLEGHGDGVNGLAFSPDGALLATGSSDGDVRLWSLPEGRCVRVLEKQSLPAFSPDAVTLATVSPKGEVTLWDADHGDQRLVIPSLDRRTFALAFTAEGDLLVGGAGPIRRVALPAGVRVGKLEGHQTAVACLRLTRDGQVLASTGADATLRLWSTRSWTELRRLALKPGGTFQIAVAADTDRVAVSADHVVELFSLKEGRLLERLVVPVKQVHGVAISPDGRFLANAAADGKVRVWQLG